MSNGKIAVFIKKTILFISLIVLSILSLLYYNYKEEEKELQIKKYFDFNSELLLNTIEEERLNALTVSLILSQNGDVDKCYSEKNHEKCSEILQKYIKILSNIPLYKNILIHMHTKDLKSLARSWDLDLYGDDLKDFRYTLSEVKRNLQPVSGIEVGRCGVYVRGISPVFDNKFFVGSIEVMLDFEHLNELAKRQGYNLFIVIDKKYTTDCFYDEQNLLNDHLIINKKGANFNVLQMVKKFDFTKRSFVKIDSNYFYARPFNDIKNNHIGYLIMHFNANKEERNVSILNLLLK